MTDRPGKFVIGDDLGFGVAEREVEEIKRQIETPEDLERALAETEALRRPEALRDRAPIHRDFMPKIMADLAEVLKRTDHGLAPALVESIRSSGHWWIRGRDKFVLRRMPLNECRGNVDRLLKLNPLWHLAIGFAWLRETELWVRHCWALNEKARLVETTVPFDVYFGVALEGEPWAEYYARKATEPK